MDRSDSFLPSFTTDLHDRWRCLYPCPRSSSGDIGLEEAEHAVREAEEERAEELAQGVEGGLGGGAYVCFGDV